MTTRTDSGEPGQTRRRQPEGPAWLPLLACPACRTELASVDRCAACGAAFGSSDGLPRLWTPELRATVTMEHRAARSSVDSALLERVLRQPEAELRERALPYHLHPAHAAELAALGPGGRVLEVGCGGGQNRAWMRGRGLDYVGVDISTTRVFEWLQEHGGPDLLCDAHFLPFRDGVFDCVYSAAVLEHLVHPWLAVREVFRTLRPGGAYLGTVSFLEPLHDDSLFHMSPHGVLEILTAQGFEVCCIWPGEDRWSVFYAVPEMAGRGPVRWLRHLGRAMAGLFALQHWLLNLARAATGRCRVPAIFARSVVAGSIYWIARRPDVAGPAANPPS